MTFSPLRCVGQPFQMTAIVSPCTTVCALRWITLVHLEHPDLILFKVTVHGAWKNIPQIIKILPKTKTKQKNTFILYFIIVSKSFMFVPFYYFVHIPLVYIALLLAIYFWCLYFFFHLQLQSWDYTCTMTIKSYFFLFYSITKAYLSKFYLVFWGNKFA